MRTTAAELVERREIVPGTWLHSWHAPWAVSGARAGQYVHLRTIEPGGLPVRRPLPIATADPASGTLTTQAPGAPPSRGWAGSLRVGDTVDLFGPLGRPFEVDSRSRHLLLIAEGASLGALRLLIDEAIRDGRSGRRCCSGPRRRRRSTRRACSPTRSSTSSRPRTGRWATAGSVLDLVLEYEAWADQSFACGLVVAARGAGARWPSGVATGWASRRSGASGAAAGR